MGRPQNEVPALRYHKASNRAFVSFQGKTHYLGKWGSRTSKENYSRFIAEVAVSNSPATTGSSLQEKLTVSGVAVRYLKWAKSYYRKNGKPTATIDRIILSLKPLKRLYGRTYAADFGPLQLKAVRGQMIDTGLARKTINDRTQVLKHLFKWGVSEGLIPPSVHHGLTAVDGLRRGRTTAPEPEPVRPVSAEIIEKTLQYLPSVPADMVRVQRLTGMRPGELLIMQPVDLDTSCDIWTYQPSQHKNEHHGKDRVILLGPKAQAILAGYLVGRHPEQYIFCPKESEQLRHINQRRKRKSPVQPSQKNRKRKKPKWQAGDRYDVASYRRAIERACKKAEVERWTPHRLRHTAATEIRKEFGLEAAQVILGHSRADVTQIYAETSLEKAAEVAKLVG
jgi:integrase